MDLSPAVILYDANGNAISSITDSAGRNRLAVDAKLTGASVLVTKSIKYDFVKNGAVSSLLVNGSVTPQVYTYTSDPTYDIFLQEIKFTLVANSIPFGTNYFGSVAGPLTNGVLVQVISEGVTVTLGTLKQDEDFVDLASPGGFWWVVSNKDLLTVDIVLGGSLKLLKNSADKVLVTVRDQITTAGNYFKCYVKGNLGA